MHNSAKQKENEDKNRFKRQKAALASFIGKMKFDKSFNHAELDSDLAKITDQKKTRS